MTIHADRHIGPVNPRLFGSFVEHLGRCVYAGIYEPGAPHRRRRRLPHDVLELVRELGVTAIRYPGRQLRLRLQVGGRRRAARPAPARLDLAWHSTETNQFGLDEFMRWLREGRQRADDGRQPRHPRRRRGAGPPRVRQPPRRHRLPTSASPTATEPFDIQMWCLGNEMDGPWQIGHRPADDYGKLAARPLAPCACRPRPRAGRLRLAPARRCRPSARGSARCCPSLRPGRLHLLPRLLREQDGDLGSFLASAVDMDRFIETVVATADDVRAEREARTSASTSPSTSGTSGTSPLRGRRQDHRRRRLARGAAAAGGRLHRHRRRRLRQALIALLRHADRVHAPAWPSWSTSSPRS